MERRIPLEPAADEVCTAASKPPLIFQLPYKEGRKALEEMQDSYVYKFPANIKSIKYNTGDWGSIPVYIVTPEKAESIRSVIFYIHGAGWVFGSFHTHEKLVRELAARTESLVVFPEYTRSPEAKFPTAIEQCYKLLCDVPVIAAAMFPQVDINTLTVAGDSVGGNMAIDMSLMSKFRDGPAVSKQLLYYPVTNDNFNTSS